MNLKKNHYSRRALALLLTLVMCVGMIPTAFAAQQNSYHDPAEHWMQASGRTNELDANSVVTRETFKCGECGKATSFEVFRVPEYGDGENPVVLKSEFLLSLCEQLIGAGKLSAKEKSIIDRCTAQVYRDYIRGGYQGQAPTLQDFHAELLRQPEKEAQDVALAIELFTDGSLNTFAKPTNVDTNARILCYDIRDLGKQLLPVGMLVVLDSIFNRIIRNRGLKRNTWIYIDEIYLLFQHEYSANFLFTLWKRMRKYQACGTGISQNIEDLLQSHTARTMLANSEFLIMLNQAATDREELAHLLNISDNQLSYITNVDSGRGLIKCGSAIVPFVDHFPKNKLYRLMTTKPSDLAA